MVFFCMICMFECVLCVCGGGGGGRATLLQDTVLILHMLHVCVCVLFSVLVG